MLTLAASELLSLSSIAAKQLQPLAHMLMLANLLKRNRSFLLDLWHIALNNILLKIIDLWSGKHKPENFSG